MKDISPLRSAQYKQFKAINLDGSILDLGGDTRSEYQSLFQGNFEIKTVNLTKDSGAHIIHDLEKIPIPVSSESYDGVLLINVLEHIYHAEQLVRETYRVVRPGGIIVIAVPFLFPVHPSPRDYWRFTDEALRTMLSEIGFEHIAINSLGTGIFSVTDTLWTRLFPKPVRILYGYISQYLSVLLDNAFLFVARRLGKGYKREHYPLGYVVTAKKPQ